MYVKNNNIPTNHNCTECAKEHVCKYCDDMRIAKQTIINKKVNFPGPVSLHAVCREFEQKARKSDGYKL